MPRPRKVLLIVENQAVPFDDRVWKEAQALRDHGYQVTVICPTAGRYPAGYELLEKVHIYRYPMLWEGSGALGYAFEYFWAILCQMLLAFWVFVRRGFGVIQGCNPPDTIFLVAWPFKVFGVGYIFDHHDVCPELYESKYARRDMAYRILWRLESLTFATAKVTIATNQSYKELAIRRGGMKPENVFVVRNGPDLDRFRAVAPKPELKQGKKFLIGYVGTMEAQDGLDLLIDVAAILRDAGRCDLHFTCVGGGTQLKRLRQMVVDKGLEEWIDFTGRVPFETLMGVLSTADLCVNPDPPCPLNDISTMIKIMEYMALGKPMVAFDTREGRFSAGEACLYAEGPNPQADFAAKILHLLDHAEERERRGAIGRNRVESELAWKYSVPHLLAAYEKAFSANSRKSLP